MVGAVSTVSWYSPAWARPVAVSCTEGLLAVPARPRSLPAASGSSARAARSLPWSRVTFPSRVRLMPRSLRVRNGPSSTRTLLSEPRSSIAMDRASGSPVSGPRLPASAEAALCFAISASTPLSPSTSAVTFFAAASRSWSMRTVTSPVLLSRNATPSTRSSNALVARVMASPPIVSFASCPCASTSVGLPPRSSAARSVVRSNAEAAPEVELVTTSWRPLPVSISRVWIPSSWSRARAASPIVAASPSSTTWSTPSRVKVIVPWPSTSSGEAKVGPSATWWARASCSTWRVTVPGCAAPPVAVAVATASLLEDTDTVAPSDFGSRNASVAERSDDSLETMLPHAASAAR
jgi:hypothetical protein